MSTSENDVNDGPDERAALKALEGAVGGLLERVSALAKRAERADTRREELEELLRSITTGDESPASMHVRLRELENENVELRDRLGRGRDTVERLVARLRFLEDQR